MALDSVLSLATANIAGTTYLFAAGTEDDGVSVFAVAANGSLINVANVTDTAAPELALDTPFALAISGVGGSTFLTVAGASDGGVSVFRIDTTGLTITAPAATTSSMLLTPPQGNFCRASLAMSSEASAATTP